MGTKIVYDQETMQTMALFENITHARVKDFFDDPVQDRLVFIVQKGELWKALGKAGINAKRLEEKFKRKIKIVEFADDLLTFIKNMVQPLKVEDLTEEDGIVTIRHDDIKTKGLLIGKNARNLRNLEVNVRRHYEVKEIKVV